MLNRKKEKKISACEKSITVFAGKNAQDFQKLWLLKFPEKLRVLQN